MNLSKILYKFLLFYIKIFKIRTLKKTGCIIHELKA